VVLVLQKGVQKMRYLYPQSFCLEETISAFERRILGSKSASSCPRVAWIEKAGDNKRYFQK
jgi:hypothetical protein